ncbi:hypothetical protein BGZ60DRAFT_188821 [Tricladium varicosporioides]|nr:hypothetical protein BGZ60DRAFT_188821 [Hymenoscyphus varicosporioides]
MAALLPPHNDNFKELRYSKSYGEGRLRQSAVVGQLASQLGASMTTSDLHTLINQILHSSPTPKIELKPVYQLDTARGCLKVKTVDLEEHSKIPMDAILEENAQDWASTTQRQLRYMPTRPTTCFAFAVSINSSAAGGPGLFLEDVEMPIAKGLTCGLWKVHWLLLFRRQPVYEPFTDNDSRASTIVTSRLSLTSPETAVESEEHLELENEKIWPAPPTMKLSATYDPGNCDTSTIASEVMMGSHVFWPKESVGEEGEWQVVSMDKALFIPGRDLGVRERERLRFSLNFENWEHAMERCKWTMYFGGIRLSPAHGIDH